MDYEEMIAWLNRYRKAKQAEPRLRERLQNENRRAEYTDILRSASPATSMAAPTAKSPTGCASQSGMSASCTE